MTSKRMNEQKEKLISSGKVEREGRIKYASEEDLVSNPGKEEKTTELTESFDPRKRHGTLDKIELMSG